MSITVACLVVRDLLRDLLPDFYTLPQHKEAACRLMPDDRPAPGCGEEFIAIYGSAWRQGDSEDGYYWHESYGVAVAVTHRTGSVPFDRIGEVSIARDEPKYVKQLVPLETRIRQINQIIHTNYEEQAAKFAAIITARGQDPDVYAPYEKLNWSRSDSWPKLVGPNHFHATDTTEHPTGILWRTFFTAAPTIYGIE